MKNFFYLLFHFKWRALFAEETHDGFIQFFRFLFVGGAATLVDMGVGVAVRNLLPAAFRVWLVLFALSADAVAGAVGFAVGLAVNYLLSTCWVFRPKDINRVKEFAVFVAISLVGLCINTAVVELCGLLWQHSGNAIFLLKKLIATFITLIWNFSGRKLILYRNR